MAEIYESDRDEVEKIKKWWEENGKTTTIGLILGLGGVFGWSGWQSYQTAQAEAASSLYAQIANAAAADDFARVRERADALLGQFPDSGYAVLTTLYLSKAALVQGDRDQAMAHLEWVLNNADEAEYQAIARLRLARLALDAGDPQRAWQLAGDGSDAADSDAAKAYEPALQALRGDILRAQGKLAEARQAYEEAVQAHGEATAERLRLRLELDALGRYNIPLGDGA